MKKLGMNLTQALEHVKSRRPQAAPNIGFMVQLKDFETALQGRFFPTETASICSSFLTFNWTTKSHHMQLAELMKCNCQMFKLSELQVTSINNRTT